MASDYVIPILILFLLLFAVLKKDKPYNSFVEGTNQSIDLVKDIFPYIVAVFLFIEVFDKCGMADFVQQYLHQYLTCLAFQLNSQS